jgi:hypothetical protein
MGQWAGSRPYARNLAVHGPFREFVADLRARSTDVSDLDGLAIDQNRLPVLNAREEEVV